MRMGAMGDTIAGGNKNNAKRAPNESAVHVFGCMSKGRKKHELGNEGNGCQETSWGRIIRHHGGFGAARYMHQ